MLVDGVCCVERAFQPPGADQVVQVVIFIGGEHTCF